MVMPKCRLAQAIQFMSGCGQTIFLASYTDFDSVAQTELRAFLGNATFVVGARWCVFYLQPSHLHADLGIEWLGLVPTLDEVESV